MTGREKVEAAFTNNGTSQIPAVTCYDFLYVRDHFQELTSCPWWYEQSPSIEHNMKVIRDVVEATNFDWKTLKPTYSRKERENLVIRDHQENGDGVFLINTTTGSKTKLTQPVVGGWDQSANHQSAAEDNSATKNRSVLEEKLSSAESEVESAIPLNSKFNSKAFREEGRCDLADMTLSEFGDRVFPIFHVTSPLQRCYELWGFEGMMILIAQRPDLIHRACKRFLERAIDEVYMGQELGASAIWIEECFSDVISPNHYKKLSAPYVKALSESIRDCRMNSIYYFTGNPASHLNAIFELPVDALSFEEGKKGFDIDILEIARLSQGKFALLGNLDAIGILQKGSPDDLRSEIERQLKAAKINGNRFIMSTGSPITPETPLSKVRMYCDMVHEY